MAGAIFGGPLLICLLNFTLNEKSSVHSLQFGLKYHVSSDLLWAQIMEHTDRNYVTVALYYIGVELENLLHRENIQTHREFNCRGHSNPSWIVGLSRPTLNLKYGQNLKNIVMLELPIFFTVS